MSPAKKPGKRRSSTAPPGRRRSVPAAARRQDLDQIETLLEREAGLARAEGDPALSGGDVDADWSRAEASGEETVGGSVVTPDQDVVDELGRALGVEQESDAEVRTSEEILRTRDRHYWHLERRAAEGEERRA